MKSAANDTSTTPMAPKDSNAVHSDIEPAVLPEADVPIVKGTRGKRKSPVASGNAKDKSANASKARKTVARKRASKKSTARIADSSAADPLPSCHCRETKAAVTNLQHEVTLRLDGLRGDMEKDREEWRKERGEERRRREEWREAVLLTLAAIAQGRKQVDEEGNASRSVQQMADDAKEYVKLVIACDFLSIDGGDKIFGAVSDSGGDDSDLTLEAAKKVIGNTASEDAVNDFLHECVTVRRNKKDTVQRVGVYIADGMNRIQEAIRESAVSEFFQADVMTEDEEDVRYQFKVVGGTSSSNEEKMSDARKLHTRSDMFTHTDFEDAWKRAWIASKLVAHSNALSCSANLKSSYTNRSLMEIPPMAEGVTYRISGNVYAMGFVVMKVLKAIQLSAKVKNRSPKASHEPFWIKHTLQLNKVLRINCGYSEDPIRRDGIVRNIVGNSLISWGMLMVVRVLYQNEIEALQDKLVF